MPALASSIPRLFEVGYRIARRSSDDGVRQLAFEVLSKYLDWWLSPVKQDAQTGLITYVFEESLCEPVDSPQTMAPIDLQVAVAIGCAYVCEIAEWVGEAETAARYRKAFDGLKTAINTYCWDEEDGAYYNFNVKTLKRSKRLIVSTFDPLRLGIAPDERVPRLLEKLTDPTLFNWGVRPLTSLAKTNQTMWRRKVPMTAGRGTATSGRCAICLSFLVCKTETERTRGATGVGHRKNF
jgi:hypothetical protein